MDRSGDRGGRWNALVPSLPWSPEADLWRVVDARVDSLAVELGWNWRSSSRGRRPTTCSTRTIGSCSLASLRLSAGWRCPAADKGLADCAPRAGPGRVSSWRSTGSRRRRCVVGTRLSMRRWPRRAPHRCRRDPVSTPEVWAAFGCEVMDMTDDLEQQRPLREAPDKGVAVAGLEDGLERLRWARAAQTALAGLPAEKFRESFWTRRTTLAGGRPRRSARPVATFSGYTTSPDDEKGHLELLRDGL